MISYSDLKYLERVINANNIVLFLGAGFSSDCTNILDKSIPLVSELKNIFWDYLEYSGDIDNSDMQKLFDNALNFKKGHKELSELLKNNYTCKDIPEWYDFLTNVYWYKIYTTNIDDLVEKVFKRSKTHISKLDIIIGTYDDYKERDSFLDSIQYIKLHGDINDEVSKITFSTTQYATRSSTIGDIWYENFIRDYYTKPTLFIGTELNEPIFFKYLMLREGKTSREGKLLEFKERRAKSFLICPDINKANKDFYENSMNLICIEATAKEFFNYIWNKIKIENERLQILKYTHPNFMSILEIIDTTDKNIQEKLFNFSNCFINIHSLIKKIKPNYEKDFLLGYEPKWDDLFNDLDAPREITQVLIDKVKKDYEEKVLIVTTLIGSAGSGKSTTLMRAALTLKQEGYNIYFSDGRKIPNIGFLSKSINYLDRKIILFIDNGEISAPAIPNLLEDLEKIKYPPVIVLASQANLYDRLEMKLAGKINPELLLMPNLARQDIINIISVLNYNGLLGKLQGKSKSEQINEFESRAKRQILVAMKEATSGEGFDVIIKKEYSVIEPKEARILMLCTCLASSINFSLTSEQFVRCSDLSPYEAFGMMERTLRDMVVYSSEDKSNVSVRHSYIATKIIEDISDKIELKLAYIKLLKVLSTDFNVKYPRRSPAFRLYQLIINHDKIYQRFEMEINMAREIYESIQLNFKEDWQFWLQYGSLELEYGELSLAENYLNQAETLNNTADFIIHAKAHLLLKKSINAINIVDAFALRNDAEKILNKQFENPTLIDPYPYHILCSQYLIWIRKWVTKYDKKKKEFEKLLAYAKEGKDRYPENEKLGKLYGEIFKEYLELGIS